MINEACPICGAHLAKQNGSLKERLKEGSIKLDYAGRAICTKCADWLENTEWD